MKQIYMGCTLAYMGASNMDEIAHQLVDKGEAKMIETMFGDEIKYIVIYDDK